jgi:repressor LexA
MYTIYVERKDVMRESLTERQREIFSFILEVLEEGGYPPTIREIADRFGIKSPNGVRGHLKALERKGYVQRGWGNRSIEVVPDLRRDRGIPVIGQVPAGSPLLAEEHLEGVLNLKEGFGGGKFALRVVGESMIDDGIHDGDYVIVRPQSSVEPGEIGVALIGEEATVKRIYPELSRIRLQPANSTFEPLYIDEYADDFRILGKVVGLVRWME